MEFLLVPLTKHDEIPRCFLLTWWNDFKGVPLWRMRAADSFIQHFSKWIKTLKKHVKIAGCEKKTLGNFSVSFPETQMCEASGPMDPGGKIDSESWGFHQLTMKPIKKNERLELTKIMAWKEKMSSSNIPCSGNLIVNFGGDLGNVNRNHQDTLSWWGTWPAKFEVGVKTSQHFGCCSN